jgi:nucleoside-diphosphate-sugar epimerase
LSSGDVYPSQHSPEVTREESEIDPGSISRYGLHKLLAEQLVRGTCNRWLIIRMGGFVGPGLKKNAIFDMLHGDPVRLDPDSRLQFISTDTAAEHVWRIVEKGVYNTILNIGGQGMLRLRDLHAEISSASSFATGSPKIVYELSLRKFEQLAGSALPGTEDEVRSFVNSVRPLKAGLA